MSLEDKQRWNTMLDNLRATSNETHTVNIHELLKELRHCEARIVQIDGQRYTHVSMEDVHGALEVVIDRANKTQDCSQVIKDSDNYELVIRELQGIKGAQRVLQNARGCSHIKNPKLYVSTTVLEDCINLYIEKHGTDL